MPGGRAGGPAGKLRAVARAWATGRGGGERSDDGATAAAADALAAIEARRRGAARPSDPVELDPADGGLVDLFQSLGSQWRTAGMTGVRIGLDYAAVPPVAAMMGIAVTPELFQDLRVMEAAALAAWAS